MCLRHWVTVPVLCGVSVVAGAMCGERVGGGEGPNHCVWWCEVITAEWASFN